MTGQLHENLEDQHGTRRRRAMLAGWLQVSREAWHPRFADFLMWLVLCIVPQFVVGAWRKDEEGASVTCHEAEDSGRASTN